MLILEPDAMRDVYTWMQSFGQFQPLDLDAFERFIAAELTGPDLGTDVDQPLSDPQ